MGCQNDIGAHLNRIAREQTKAAKARARASRPSAVALVEASEYGTPTAKIVFKFPIAMPYRQRAAIVLRAAARVSETLPAGMSCAVCHGERTVWLEDTESTQASAEALLVWLEPVARLVNRGAK